MSQTDPLPRPTERTPLTIYLEMSRMLGTRASTGPEYGRLVDEYHEAIEREIKAVRGV